MGKKLGIHFFYGSVIALFLVAIILPLGFTFYESFFVEQKLSVQHYRDIFHADNLQLLFWSILSSSVVALISTIIGAVTGFIVSKTDVPFRSSIKILLLIPLLISPYYFAVAWRDFFVVTELPLELQGSLASVAFVLVLSYTPLSMLIFSSAFSNINQRLEEAGLLITDNYTIFRSITLPLVKPAIISSFVLVFILAASEMSVASYYLAKSYTSEIFIKFSAFYNHESAIAMSSILILVCVVLILFERSYLVNAPFFSIGTKGSLSRIVALKKWRVPTFLALCFYIFLTIFTPIIVLAVQAFGQPVSPPMRDGNLPRWMIMNMPTGTAESGYYIKQAFELIKPVIGESLLYALIGAVILCTFGFIFAYFAHNKKIKSLDLLLLIVFAVPGTVLGIALIRFYNRPMLEFIYGSFAIIVIGYVGKFAFVATKIIGHSLIQIPKSLEEAATISGASFFTTLKKIVLPLAADGFFVAFIICFVFCLAEISMSIIVYPPGTSLLPIQIATSMHNTPEGLVSSMVLLALLTTLIALGLLFLLRSLLMKKLKNG